MDWILDAIIDEIEKNLKLYSSVKVGSLPQRSGIAMYRRIIRFYGNHEVRKIMLANPVSFLL